jgi:hypothetical protein
MDAQRQLDANERFVLEHKHCLILLADAPLTTLQFCPIGLPLAPDMEALIASKQFRFLGLLGIAADGTPCSLLTVEPDPDTLAGLKRVYVQAVRARCDDWLEKLWLLQPEEAAACVGSVALVK